MDHLPALPPPRTSWAGVVMHFSFWAPLTLIAMAHLIFFEVKMSKSRIDVALISSKFSLPLNGVLNGSTTGFLTAITIFE